MTVADRFVQAPDHWPRPAGAGVRAIVIHMAEGGGTVSWLTRDDGNSSHYVVEYNGRITQMVLESQAAGSINPKLTRTSNDPAYAFLGESIVYGVTANKAALGAYWNNANAAVIAIEVEGFASEGPSLLQQASLIRLVADIRKRYPNIPVLGHRDFQSYKACPGKKIRWADFGGHGKAIATPPPEEVDVIPAPITDEVEHMVTANEGHSWRDLDGTTVLATGRPALAPRLSPFGVTVGTTTLRAIYATVGGKRRIVLIVPATSELVPTCDTQIAEAVAATKASARVTFG